MNDSGSKKRFLQVLTGLALSAASATPALASTISPSPTPAASSHVASKVDFAKNLGAKIGAAAPMVAAGKYKQTFGKLWVEYGPFFEIVNPMLQISQEEPETAALLPSEVFQLISRA